MLTLVVPLQLVQPSEGSSPVFLNMGIPFCPEGRALRDAVRHTALQPGLAMSVPGVLTQDQLKTDMRIQLPCVDASRFNLAWGFFNIPQTHLVELQFYWFD